MNAERDLKGTPVADNYEVIVRQNLARLYADLPGDLAANLPGEQDKDSFIFEAFGEKCRIEPDRIILGDGNHPSVLGILISLYAINCRPDPCVPFPFKAFREFPDSAPYVGAFTTHTEQVLAPRVDTIRENLPSIREILKGEDAPAGTGGDFSVVLYPLPKIALCYIFYEADEDFPASATCLYSNNAGLFLPVDALADVGEYTSRKILGMFA